MAEIRAMSSFPEVTFSRVKRRGKIINCGRRCLFDAGGDYEVEALEQLAESMNHQPTAYSARLYAPADEITPYRWIKAWITCESWNEALVAAYELSKKVLAGEPLGEHEFIRPASQ